MNIATLGTRMYGNLTVKRSGQHPVDPIPHFAWGNYTQSVDTLLIKLSVKKERTER